MPWQSNPPLANRQTLLAAQATSSTLNQSLAFLLVLSPKRRPSQTTSIILCDNSLGFVFVSNAVRTDPLQLAAWHSAGSLRFCLVTIYFIKKLKIDSF